MERKPTVLVRHDDNVLLNKHFKVVTLQNLLDQTESPSEIDGIVFTKFFNKVPGFRWDLLPKMNRLQVVTPLGIGFDYMEDFIEYFHNNSVIVALNTGEKYECKAVADFAIGLMLSCGRGIHSGYQHVQKVKDTPMVDWIPYNVPLANRAHSFNGKCIGIIGMGNIGYQIAKRAFRGFDMNVLYFGRTRKPEDKEKSVGATYYRTLATMLPLCDYVVVSCPSNPQSRNLLGAEAFSMMKPNCIVINISRGDIIDTDALTEALKTGQIAGAGLDVTAPEPLPPGHPLLDMENVLITPHIAWSLKEVMEEVDSSQCRNLVDVLIHGKRPRHVLESALESSLSRVCKG